MEIKKCKKYAFLYEAFKKYLKLKIYYKIEDTVKKC